MTVSVIGCGASAKEWFNTPFDYLSIGVNDCFKFGVNPDYLLVVNAPFKFQPSKENNHTDRLKVIKQTQPKKFVTNLCQEWSKHKKPDVCINLLRFGKRVNRTEIYHSKTSPFIAMSLAYKLGATDIILWGVDFLDHRDFKPGKRETEFEMEEYKRFADVISKDCKVWTGSKESAMSKYFPVHEQ